MNNKKLIRKCVILIMGCVLAASFLAACSGGSGNEEKGEEQKQEEKAPEKEPEEEAGEEKEMAEIDLDKISINTQSSIRIEGSRTVYMDPFKRTEETHDADLILITHSHYDHLDPESLKNVAKDGVYVVCPKAIKDEVYAAMDEAGVEYNLLDIEVGSTVIPSLISKKDSITIQALPAYNKDKSFHKKEYGWVGYVLKLDGVYYFDAGDSDVIPEYESSVLDDIDVAFLPVGGTYTMTAKEAAPLADSIGPKYLIPIHYGSIVGSSNDVDTLKKGIKNDGIKVVTKVEDAE